MSAFDLVREVTVVFLDCAPLFGIASTFQSTLDTAVETLDCVELCDTVLEPLVGVQHQYVVVVLSDSCPVVVLLE
ncbi:hypothetical protein [Halovenus salina]|uniref:Halobacterial output domain-containing protein n=1 Tax=Halovenus salina TaxID=1510225 RepID=A0ABD5W7E8_9EURY